MIIDTHSHLNDEKFKDDYENIISDFEKNNVKSAFVVGCDKEGIFNSLNISQKYDSVFSIIGLHPEYADEFDDEIYHIIDTYSQNEKVVAIGEIGLDYHYNSENKEKQKEVFIKQLELAFKHNLPVSLHIRDAHADAIELLKEHKNLLKFGGVVHCFSGSEEIAVEYLKLGLYLGFGGVVTFKNAKKLPDVVAITPLDKFVLETDAPYLAPDPFRGTRNEPKLIKYIVDKVASIKLISPQEVERQAEINTKNLFKRFNLL